MSGQKTTLSSRAKRGTPRVSGAARNGHNANGAAPLTMKAWSGYEGSNWSSARGYVYFPTLDTARDLDDYTLYELRKKSRWLYINVGLGTRIADGIAGMVGSLTPIPLTDDKEWNQLVIKKFTNEMGADLVFDVAGKFNFWSCQPMMTTCRLIDGDILAVLTETESKMARCMFYEAHQIGNAETALDQSQWFNGVRNTPQMRALAYRILTDEGKKSQDISAADAILHCLYRRSSRSRGEPAYRHAVNHMLDRAEVIGYMKQGSKNTNQMGYYITRAANGGASTPTLPAFGAGPLPQAIPKADGSGTTNVQVEAAYRGGKLLGLDPGEEIKTLLDQRPHPNQVQFLDYLVRDISWGTGFSPDILWDIAKIGGAAVRYVMADAQKTVEQMQTLLADQFCSRFWVYYIAKELKEGRLRKCQDPDWWKHGWQPEQKMTVDIGRDGKMYLDMHKAGMITLQRFFSAGYGTNWKPELDQFIDERQYIVQSVMDRKIKMPDGTERPMTMAEAFPPEPGVSNVTERTTPADDPTAGGDPTAPANTPANSPAK